MHPSGKYVAFGFEYSCQVSTYSIDSKKYHQEYHFNKAEVTALRFSPDGKFFASGDLRGDICINDFEFADQITTFTGHEKAVNCLSYSKDGKYLLSGSADKTVRIWDVQIQVQLLTLRGHTDEVLSCAFSTS